MLSKLIFIKFILLNDKIIITFYYTTHIQLIILNQCNVIDSILFLLESPTLVLKMLIAHNTFY